MLQPIFDEAADKVKDLFQEPGRVVFGKVDCDQEGKLQGVVVRRRIKLNIVINLTNSFVAFAGDISTRFHITKYPTLKVIRNGQPAKREYRGQRSVDAFVEYVKKQLADPIKEFFSLTDIQNIDVSIWLDPALLSVPEWKG